MVGLSSAVFLSLFCRVRYRGIVFTFSRALLTMCSSSDAAGNNLSSHQLWLQSRHRWSKDGEFLRTGKTECCFLYSDYGRSGSLGMNESRSLCSEPKNIFCTIRWAFVKRQFLQVTTYVSLYIMSLNPRHIASLRVICPWL